jgi:hypothetical protein
VGPGTYLNFQDEKHETRTLVFFASLELTG